MNKRHLGSRAWDAVFAENANTPAALRRAQRTFDADASKLRGEYRQRFIQVLRPRFLAIRDEMTRELNRAMREALRRGLPMTGKAPQNVEDATRRAVATSKVVHEELEALLAEQENKS